MGARFLLSFRACSFLVKNKDPDHPPLLLLRAGGPKTTPTPSASNRLRVAAARLRGCWAQVLPHGDSRRPGLVSLRHAGPRGPFLLSGLDSSSMQIPCRPRRSASCLISGDRAVQRPQRRRKHPAPRVTLWGGEGRELRCCHGSSERGGRRSSGAPQGPPPGAFQGPRPFCTLQELITLNPVAMLGLQSCMQSCM